jgi:WD40 repeat protein
VGAVGAAAAVVLILVIVLVTIISTPAAKKHGAPAASPRATSPASRQAGVAIAPAPGTALSATATVTLTDPDGFLGIAFSPDGKALAASSESNDQSAGHVDIWNSPSERRPAVLPDTAAGGNLVNGMAFSPRDASTLAVADLNGVDIRNLAARSSSAYDDPDGWAVTDVAYAPDGKTLAECNETGHVYLLDAVNGHWLAQSFTDPLASQLIQVAFSPDGKTLAAADSAGNVFAWRLSGGAPLVIKGTASYSYPTQTIAFSPDGGTLAVALRGGVQLWDLATRTLTARLTDDVMPDAIAFSPHGTALAVGDEDGSLYLWDLATRQVTIGDSLGTGWTELEFSPDGRTLAALGDGASEISLYRIGYPASSPATQFL